MFGIIKKFTLNLITLVNIVAIALMLASGYSDHITPARSAIIACAGMIFPFTLILNLAFLPLWVVLCWKRLWIPIAGLALAYAPIHIYIPMNMSQQASDDALKVVSWNVAGYGANHKYNHAFDSAMTYLKEQNADIVCLMEDINGSGIAFSRYKEYFEHNDTTRVSSPQNSTINCVGIHTRFPILKKERIEYESKTNGSVAYYLDLGGADTLLVIINHLESTHLTTGERERYGEIISGDMPRDTVKTQTISLLTKISDYMVKRAPQAQAVHEYVEAHKHLPIIVCGDFNDTPISYTRHTIAQGLTDCYAEAGKGIGVSFNKKGFLFRIDHMMCSDDFEPQTCEIDAKNDISDHYPLICRLKMHDKP